MSRATLLVVIGLCLVACGSDDEARSTSDEPELANLSTRMLVDRGAVSPGKDVYDRFCASCHDTGVDGAPVTGNPADWENRSALWQAVLMEHAKAGYLDMPAGGGVAEISDLSVSEAVDYMMLATFPEKLPDR